MNKLQPIWLIIFILAMLVILFGVGCKVFFAEHSPSKMRKIANNIQISEDWTEITPQPLVKATTKIQYIGLKLDNIKGWKDDAHETLQLNNGDELKIEIELVDEKGNITSLFPNGIGEFIEFGKRTKSKENLEDAYFQTGTNFYKIRLRSSKQILVSEIVWGEFEF